MSTFDDFMIDQKVKDSGELDRLRTALADMTKQRDEAVSVREVVAREMAAAARRYMEDINAALAQAEALHAQLESTERQLAEALALATTAQIHRDEAQARENVASNRNGQHWFKLVDEADALRHRVAELEHELANAKDRLGE